MSLLCAPLDDTRGETCIGPQAEPIPSVVRSWPFKRHQIRGVTWIERNGNGSWAPEHSCARLPSIRRICGKACAHLLGWIDMKTGWTVGHGSRKSARGWMRIVDRQQITWTKPARPNHQSLCRAVG